jgi:organic radical activating enzyme
MAEFINHYATMESPNETGSTSSVNGLKGTALPVMEAFYTLQGEGSFTGKPAWFIRLGGCDVGCVWCDVKASWNAADHPLQSVSEIVKTAVESPCRMAVITGGEPCMYQLSPLVDALHEAGFTVNLETSGAYPLSGTIDWICVSPKKFKAPLPEVLAVANELKVVIFNKSDFEWALLQAEQTKASCRLFLQPEYEKSAQMIPSIIEFLKSHPNWSLSLQTHKFIGIP